MRKDTGFFSRFGRYGTTSWMWDPAFWRDVDGYRNYLGFKVGSGPFIELHVGKRLYRGRVFVRR